MALDRVLYPSGAILNIDPNTDARIGVQLSVDGVQTETIVSLPMGSYKTASEMFTVFMTTLTNSIPQIAANQELIVMGLIPGTDNRLKLTLKRKAANKNDYTTMIMSPELCTILGFVYQTFSTRADPTHPEVSYDCRSAYDRLRGKRLIQVCCRQIEPRPITINSKLPNERILHTIWNDGERDIFSFEADGSKLKFIPLSAKSSCPSINIGLYYDCACERPLYFSPGSDPFVCDLDIRMKSVFF
jgi:hypothetical protein